MATFRRDLAQAIQSQAATKLRELQRELIEPWFEPPPAPLTDTLPPAQLADPDSRFVSIEGIRVHYKDTGGDSNAPAVLMLHGFNGSTFNWRDVMSGISEDASLPSGRRVIAFDRPPFGLTERPLQWDTSDWNPYTCEGGARLAAGLLEALGIQSAVIIGHSMGAVVAMELLKAHPEKVAGLVLVAPALPAQPHAFRRAMTATQQLQALARLALLRSDTAGINYIRRTLRASAARVQAGNLQVHHDSRLARADVIDGYLRPMKADNWDRGSLLGFRAISFSEELPAYNSIQQPVLVVQGAQDSTILNTSAAAIVAQLKQRERVLTQYAEFQSCGHIPMEEYPDKFVGVVREFLAAAFGQQRSASLPLVTEPPHVVPVGDTTPAAAVGTSQAEVVRDVNV